MLALSAFDATGPRPFGAQPGNLILPATLASLVTGIRQGTRSIHAQPTAPAMVLAVLLCAGAGPSNWAPPRTCQSNVTVIAVQNMLARRRGRQVLAGDDGDTAHQLGMRAVRHHDYCALRSPPSSSSRRIRLAEIVPSALAKVGLVFDQPQPIATMRSKAMIALPVA